MALYKVTGSLPYREHKPGEEFVARLDANTEQRAIERGNIVVLDSSPTRLRPGSYRLPHGWLTETTEPREGAFSLKGAS